MNTCPICDTPEFTLHRHVRMNATGDFGRFCQCGKAVWIGTDDSGSWFIEEARP